MLLRRLFRFYGSLIFLIFTNHCYLIAQQAVRLPAGARAAALGRTGINFTDIHAAFSNQAGLANVHALTFGLVGERPFSLAEVNHVGAAVALPSGGGTFALNAQYYGIDAYNEQRIGLAYGRKLVSGLRLGAQLDFLNTRIRNYGNLFNLTAEVGLQYELFETLQVGAHIFSPVTITVTEDYDLPTIFQIGLAYQPSTKILLNAEVEQEVNAVTRFKSGLEYQIADPLLIRMGIATRPNLFTFGVGYQLENGLGIDIATSYHQVLGFSPSVGITFSEKDKMGTSK